MKNNITLKTLSDTLGISIATVSRALQGNPRIGKKTKEKVIALAKTLNYVSNPGVSMLRSNKSMRIGVMVPFLKSEFYSEIAFSFENFFEPLGYHVEVVQSRDDNQKQNHYIDYFLKSRFDGVLVSLALETKDFAGFKELENYGIPLVFFDRAPRGFECHKVTSEIRITTEKAVEFLYHKGIKTIGLLNGPSNLSVSDARLNGYLQGLNKFNLKSNQALIKSCNLSKGSVFECVKKWKDQEMYPEAVIVFNDSVALFVNEAIKQLNFSHLSNLRMVSVSNLSHIEFLENPPIASIKQKTEVISQKASDLLMMLIKDEILINNYQEEIVETELVPCNN